MVGVWPPRRGTRLFGGMGGNERPQPADRQGTH